MRQHEAGVLRHNNPVCIDILMVLTSSTSHRLLLTIVIMTPVLACQ